MLVFNFIPQPIECPNCLSNEHNIIVQLTDGNQRRKCKECGSYIFIN